MKVNGRPLPNNQKQAYMPGKLHGTQGTMGNVTMDIIRGNIDEIKDMLREAE